MSVDLDAVSDLAAQQVPDRRPQGFSLDVPERHVDAAERPRAHHAGHAMRHHGAEGLLPEPLDIAGILTDEQRRQILHRALHHARPAAALADAGDAGVRIDLEEEPIARGASAALPFRRIHPMRRRIGLLRRKLRLHHERLDVGDAQGGPRVSAGVVVP